MTGYSIQKDIRDFVPVRFLRDSPPDEEVSVFTVLFNGIEMAETFTRVAANMICERLRAANPQHHPGCFSVVPARLA